MDAKPQRPVRSLKIYGDENSIPAVAGQKTIHSRNKSSPALTTLVKAGGLKAAAKRTAFGDVSNTVNVARPRDDLAIDTKVSGGNLEKIKPLDREDRSTAFSKPAQRPVKISNLRSILDSVTSNAASLPARVPLADAQPVQQPIAPPAPARKLSKKAPVVYQDTSVDLPTGPCLDILEVAPSAASLPPIPKNLHTKACSTKTTDIIITEPRVEVRSQWRQDSRHQSAPTDLALSSSAATVDDSVALGSDGIYINDRGELSVYKFTDDPEAAEEEVVAPLPSEPLRPLEQSSQGPFPLDSYHCNQMPHVQSEFLKLEAVPNSEYQEYWEEEDEENYEEEGYVTARSFKLRDDNTTNGATTVLFPKVTQKSKKEIATAKALIEASKTPDEIDDEAWDTTMVAEYGDEIFQYMRDLEIRMLPNAHYMDNQTEIQWSMRSVLMDWLVQVHHRFGLLPETLFLCCNYIDRFLSAKIVSLGKLQLVGATAIFVASKYEEINCPSIQEIVYMVDNGFNADEILKAERFMLNMLKFELGWPGPMSFLRRISKADDYDLETRTLAKYFLEITIMDERFVGSPPSFTAAGAHCLARLMLRKGSWSPAHVYYSNYTYAQLYSLVLLMVDCCEDPRKHHAAIYEKYMDKRFKRASVYVEAEMARGFQIPDTTMEKSTSFALAYGHPLASMYETESSKYLQ